MTGPDYDLEQHQVRLMVGDPVARAYEWIKSYADQLSDTDIEGDRITTKDLVDTAMLNIYDHGPGSGNYLCRGSLLVGVSTDPAFWDQLSILTGIEIPQAKRKNFFAAHR